MYPGTKLGYTRVPPAYVVWYPRVHQIYPTWCTLLGHGYHAWLYPSTPRVYTLVPGYIRVYTLLGTGVYYGAVGYHTWLSPSTPRVCDLLPGSPRIYTLFWYMLWGTRVPNLVVPEYPQSVWFGTRVPQFMNGSILFIYHPGGACDGGDGGDVVYHLVVLGAAFRAIGLSLMKCSKYIEVHTPLVRV